jgi:hypothetical protein
LDKLISSTVKNLSINADRFFIACRSSMQL